MKTGKAAVVLILMCGLIHGVAMAQDDSDFEALLDEISSEPDTASSAVVDQPAETVSEKPEGVIPAADETVMEEAPAVEPAVLEAPVMEEASEVDHSVSEVPEPAVEAPAVEAEAVEASAPAVEEMTISEPAPDVMDIQEEVLPEVTSEPEETMSVEVEAPAVEAGLAPEAAEEMTSDFVESAPAGAEIVTEAPIETEEVTSAPAEEVGEVADTVKEEVEAAGSEGKVDLEQAAEMAAKEEVRRQAMEIQGLQSLEEGYKALAAGKFADALKYFEEANSNLPDRLANEEARARAKWGYAEAEYRVALDHYKKKENLTEARTSCERALKMVPEHTGAATLLKKIERLEVILARPVPPRKRPDVVKKKKDIAELIKDGRAYYEIKDYDRAQAVFDSILLMDEYNTDAMRFLRKIQDKRYDIATVERKATTADMMRKVRDAWNPPIREEVELPEDVVQGSVVQTKTASQRLKDKMSEIMIPSIEFRQANIMDVVNFLVEASIAGDPEGAGVNIILKLNAPGAANEASAPANDVTDDFDLGSDFPDMMDTPMPAAPTAQGGGLRTITLNLRRISLMDAIRYITEVADLKFRVEDNAVIITPANMASGRIMTRMYPVQPSIIDVIIEKEENTQERTGDFIEMGGGATTIKRGDVKDFFTKAGVPFPVGTSITYNQSISQLIVANTAENLEIFERILAQLNVIPSQVEIEARFVEVGEEDLEELGLQWILNDNWEIAQNKASVQGSERVQVNADPDGFTQGLRYFAFDRATAAVAPASAITRSVSQSPLGSILSFSSILTNPELTVILQALSQHGNTDLLSAPRVTTRSGANATIQVVREIIYPTEFEVTQPTVQSEGDLVTPPTVTPGSFETREVGVILNVTPTVGPDGYTIDLTLVPEVAELVDWIQYGSEITLESGLIGVRQARTYSYNIPQPVFSSRNATTTIVIWDGQTVVMGGLMRETLVTMEDKIPILGDIPLLGWLFRSKGQRSKKTNLLIFVTARLVDPAGKPIHKAEAMALPGSGAQVEVSATP